MSWRCPSWQILQPVDRWLQGYSAWLAGLVDLPVEIVGTLNLAVLSPLSAAALAPTARPAIRLDTSSGQVFSSGLWRFVGEGGMALVYIASGSLFGGLALVGAWYGVEKGYSSHLFWYFWGLILAGIIYGVYAIAGGTFGQAFRRRGWPARGAISAAPGH
jgi:hypothetical protein